jgi:hypothetical protein
MATRDDKTPDLFGATEARQRLATEQSAARREAAEKRRREAPVAATGRQLGEQGMERAAAGAEAEIPGWGDSAYGHLIDFIGAHRGERFTTERVKAFAYGRGLPKPRNESAWGPVMNTAARNHRIRRDGFMEPESASRHGSPNRAWVVA